MKPTNTFLIDILYSETLTHTKLYKQHFRTLFGLWKICLYKIQQLKLNMKIKQLPSSLFTDRMNAILDLW